MLHTETRFFRNAAKIMAVTVANLSLPFGFANTINDAIKSFERPTPKVEKPQTSRFLTSTEMKSRKGKTGQNPYISGSRKWGVNFKGIDLTSGNYTTSATDLSFDTGYGIPVNVTRSYSSNNPDEGPLGYGWSLSVDVRSTAGGILKKSGAPVMSVPTTFKERPSAQTNDPNAIGGVQPLAAVVATDAAGTEEVIQKDVDGILSTPPWDKNTIKSDYEYVTLGGQMYEVMKSSTTTTIDGTVYVYSKHGSYTYGTQPYGGGTGGEPSNVLKIDSATDRQGNVTNYTYYTTQASFQKYNGTVSEDELKMIAMPGGHNITFTWGPTTFVPSNRIASASDNGGRTISYKYRDGINLTDFTSAGGRTTLYSYGSAFADTVYMSYVTAGMLSVATNLLRSITDPRGLTTNIAYAQTWNPLITSLYGNIPTPIVYWVQDPNGTFTQISGGGSGPIAATQTDLGTSWSASGLGGYTDYTVSTAWGGGTVLFNGEIQVTTNATTSPPTVIVSSNDMMGAPHPAFSPQWTKTYNFWTQDMLQEIDYTYPWLRNDLHAARQLGYQYMQQESVELDNTYNFMGNPLSKSETETIVDTSSVAHVRGPVTTSYAYWDASKYYQQKAVKDPAGRFSYTDYFTNAASPGSKGQKQYVYDPKNTTFTGTGGTGDAWKGTIAPTSASTYCGTFQYDTQGRCLNVWKLQSTTTTPWTYVQTQSTFGSDGYPYWGQATQVVEDFGTGHIQRTTVNNQYTSWGKPCSVTDGLGNHFYTNYDNDGNVNYVSRTDFSPTPSVVSYTYGTSGINNGVPVTVTDGLTGVTQNIAYQASGNGIGNVSEVDQTGGSNPAYQVGGAGIHGYSTIYGYNAIGDRTSSTYVTANGTITWQYGDYVELGTNDNPNRVFQTLTKLTGAVGSAPTAEEMDYQYDSRGRLTGAAFAQTPYTGFTPSGSSPWYDSTHPAQSRARAYYTYDAGGRMLNCDHYWDTLVSGTLYYGTSPEIIGNDCAYDATLGLKTTSSVTDNTVSTPSLTGSYSFTYDPQLEFLATAHSSDAAGTVTQTWSYDAAGNRTDSVTDNLNRTTSIGGVSTTNDTLGNRLTLGSTTSYSWDVLNRMKQYVNSATTPTKTTQYEYRADGMRSHKNISTISPASSVDTEYYHDGQMPMEDAAINGSALTVTRYGLGARGIDYEEVGTGTWTSSTSRSPGTFSNIGFPIYDAHGSMIATLARASGNSFTLNNKRSYDAWGATRIGASTGDPKNRYCGNLGHQQDDESGLIYMNSRYFETSSGRFVSSDLARSGANWFVYCENSPVNNVDADGKYSVPLENILAALGMVFALMAARSLGQFQAGYIASLQTASALIVSGGLAGLAVACFAASQLVCGNKIDTTTVSWIAVGITVFGAVLALMTAAAIVGQQTLASGAVLGAFTYGLVLIGYLVAGDVDSIQS